MRVDDKNTPDPTILSIRLRNRWSRKQW
jgi:hypothetical protein